MTNTNNLNNFIHIYIYIYIYICRYRIQQLQETEAFISVKDHEEGFPNSPSFRLINPSKSEIGKISKHILDKINKSLLSNTKVNQWKNTSDAISWFKNINNKKQSSFVNFDVENFYQSISEKPLIDAIILQSHQQI